VTIWVTLWSRVVFIIQNTAFVTLWLFVHHQWHFDFVLVIGSRMQKSWSNYTNLYFYPQNRILIFTIMRDTVIHLRTLHINIILDFFSRKDKFIRNESIMTCDPNTIMVYGRDTIFTLLTTTRNTTQTTLILHIVKYYLISCVN
jgi:hypothetical protein